MKLFIDLFPIALFFLVYHLKGIYAATLTVIITAVIQLAYTGIKHKKIDFLLLASNSIVIILGGSTLLFHNELFIKWKPSVIYWVFALAFLLSPYYLNRRYLIQQVMNQALSLPASVWLKLNIAWALFFLIMGIINLWVAYHFSTATWVNFKLFGTLGLTFTFIIAQSLWLFRYHRPQDQTHPLLPTDKK